MYEIYRSICDVYHVLWIDGYGWDERRAGVPHGVGKLNAWEKRRSRVVEYMTET